jgi:hypothetical protein
MPELDVVIALLNQPGHAGYAPLRLIAAFLLIVTVYSGALLFTYWISKDE